MTSCRVNTSFEGVWVEVCWAPAEIATSSRVRERRLSRCTRDCLRAFLELNREAQYTNRKRSE